MAGGATYSEARSCYEISREFGKEVYLATTHMITPKTFTRQISLLSRGRKELGLPADRAPPKMPAWMSEPPPGAQQPKPASPQLVANGRPQAHAQSQPPTAAMQQMKLAPQQAAPHQSHASSRPASSTTPEPSKSTFKDPAQMAKEKEGKKEKKHHFKVWKN